MDQRRHGDRDDYFRRCGNWCARHRPGYSFLYQFERLLGNPYCYRMGQPAGDSTIICSDMRRQHNLVNKRGKRRNMEQQQYSCLRSWWNGNGRCTGYCDNNLYHGRRLLCHGDSNG